MKRAIQLALVAAFLTLIAGTVKADPVIFSYTLTGPGTTVTFDLPEFANTASGFVPVPDVGFYAQPTDLVINSVASNDVFAFYVTAFSGGFADATNESAFPVLQTDDGTALFTADDALTNPQMLGPGSYALTDFETETEAFTLDVAMVPAPEPSSLLLFGTGLIGLALIRKRRTAAANFTA